MNVSTELILPILETQAALASEENRRWFLEFTPKTVKWTMTDMKDMVKLFQKTGYKENVYEEELIVESEADVTMLRVDGIHNISLYCEYENPRTARGKWCKYANVHGSDSSQLPDLFSLKIASHVREERPLEDAQSPPQWATSQKNYNICKKIVYTDPKTDVHYIISMTKKTSTPSQTMLSSNVSGLQPTIECSIECPADLDPKEVVVSMVRMIQILEQNSRPITLEQQKEVLSNYDSLVEKVREKKKYDKDSYYLAPKPVTLEQVHLSDPGITYGQVSILDGYAVTDKADGERMLLFVDEKGIAYMINNAFEVRGTGWKVKRESLYNTILDGEYLPSTKRLDKSEQDMFAVFDVYFVGGESVMHLPLMSKKTAQIKSTVDESKQKKKAPMKITGDSRVDIMNAVLNGAMWDHEKGTHLELVTKVHISASGNEMFSACRKILEDATKKGSPYDIDGLIFTPVDLPVFGHYPNKPVTINGMGATWDRVLKWKPPQQNSIDFCVSIDKQPVKDIKYHRNYAKLTMSCGYRAIAHKEISVSRGLALLQTRKSERDYGEEYGLKTFTPQYYYERGVEHAYVPIDSSNVVRAENGDEITDGAIVEFGYDMNDKRPISYRWRALRVRNDKMRNIVMPTESSKEESSSKKRNRNQLKKIKANDWMTATGIWRSIHEPVTREMITGVVRAPQLVKEAIDLDKRLLGTDAVYYGRNIAREHLLSVDMLKIHGIIKGNLYKYPQQYAKNNLLEMACGMAGDMNHWQDTTTGFSFRNILGIDLVRDNITKANDGAYARVLKPRYNYGAPSKHQNYVFVIGDCSKPLHTGACSEGIDRESMDVLRELYGKTNYKKYLTFIPPFAKPKDNNSTAPGQFDMVSCQFAIHYFFETEEKLKGFMKNIRDNLRIGGLFISTFMDGNSVEKLIRDKGVNGLVEGRKLDGKVVVWAIRRIRAIEEEVIEEEEEEEEEEIVDESESEDEKKGGATMRSKKLIEVYEPNKKTKKNLHMVNVPALGDCMFIALELSAFGEEKSPKKDGSWMRERVIEKMRAILSKNDKESRELFESIKLNVDNLSPNVKEEAIEDISSDLYSDKKMSNYSEKVSGYLKWMSKKKVWGTQIELRGAMNYLERPIHIYQTVDDKTVAHTIGEDLYPGKPPVRVWFNGSDHYKALIESSLEELTEKMQGMQIDSTSQKRTTRSGKVYSTAKGGNVDSPFGCLIDVYLENTNRLIPEYIVDFQTLKKYAEQYGLELVEDRMFSDDYKKLKKEGVLKFPNFDNDPVQQQFSFLNRWVVFRRM